MDTFLKSECSLARAGFMWLLPRDPGMGMLSTMYRADGEFVRGQLFPHTGLHKVFSVH